MTPSEIADWLDRRGALFDEEAAATIRAQAEALKIATEALEAISKGNRGAFESADHMAFDKLMCASKALARIKEVG